MELLIVGSYDGKDKSIVRADGVPDLGVFESGFDYYVVLGSVALGSASKLEKGKWSSGGRDRCGSSARVGEPNRDWHDDI